MTAKAKTHPNKLVSSFISISIFEKPVSHAAGDLARSVGDVVDTGINGSASVPSYAYSLRRERYRCSSDHFPNLTDAQMRQWSTGATLPWPLSY